MTRLDEARYRAAERDLLAAVGVEVEELWVPLDGRAGRVRVLATGAGAPVLFLHGSPNTAATWLSLARSLGRRALLLERPGAGLADPVPWVDHRQQIVRLMEAVLDQLGLASVDVVGSSFGGLYAYRLALDAPGRVRRMVQIGAPAGPRCLPMPGIFRVLGLLPAIPGSARFSPRPDLEGAKDMFRQIGHGPSIDAGAIDEAWFRWYSALLCHTDTMEHLCREVRAIASPLGYRAAGAVTDEELARIEAPTMYLWGERDSFAGPEAGEALAARTPGARFERLAGMGHIPWMDAPEVVAGRLRAFLD